MRERFMVAGNHGNTRRLGAIAAFALAGVAAAGTGCNSGGAKAAATPAAPLVTVATLQPRDVPIFADFAGQTFARDTVEVRGRVTGYIEKWLFQPGVAGEGGPGALRPGSPPVRGRCYAGPGEPAAKRGRSGVCPPAGFAVAGAGKPGVGGSEPFEGAAGLRAPEAAGGSRCRLQTGPGRRSRGAQSGGCQRRRAEGERQPGRALHAHPDPVEPRQSRIAQGCAAQCGAERRVWRNPRADQRAHRRFAGACRRAGDAELDATADHHRAARSDVGAGSRLPRRNTWHGPGAGGERTPAFRLRSFCRTARSFPTKDGSRTR